MAKKSKIIALYVTTKPNQNVVNIIKSRGDTTMYEGFTSEGFVRGVPKQTDIVIWDGPEYILSTPQSSLESLIPTIANLKIPVITSEAFLNNPEEMIGRAMLSRGDRTGLQHYAPRMVLMCSLSGGVGKTTLTMTLAKRFRESQRPCAMVEAAVGRSGLLVRAGAGPTLYDCMTKSITPATWEHASYYPSDENQSRLLADEPRTRDFLNKVIKEELLVVVDAWPRNPLWPLLLDLATDVVLITAPREEAMAQTQELQQELQPVLRADQHMHLVVNQVRSLGERLAMGQGSIVLPFHERWAATYDGHLADPILAKLFPGWQLR